MTEGGAEKRRESFGERHSLSVFIMRALMTFLGTVGSVGCLLSCLRFLYGTGAFDKAASLAGSKGAEALTELSDGMGAVCAFAFFSAMMALLLAWLLGQKIRRIIPAILVTGIFPAVSIAIGIIPGYMYLIMLCLFWSMLMFDADELIGPSLFIVPLFCFLFLVLLAAVPHRAHERFEFVKPAGQTAAPTTVGGENHDPPALTESTGETRPNNDDPRDAHPDAEGEMRPDGRDENGMEIPRRIARAVIVLLVIMIIVALIPLSRLIRLRFRKKRTHSRDKNASAIAVYRYMEQLAAFAGSDEDTSGEIWKRATEIGLKARFSGEMISSDELGEMHRLALFYREICMKRADRVKHLIGKYYLAL